MLFLGCWLAGPPTAAAQTLRTNLAKRVGIVYSASSAKMFWGDATGLNYSYPFMAVQHQAMMAGIPYDLLTEDDLTDITKIVNYDTLVCPSFRWVNRAKAAAIQAALLGAVTQYNVGLIAAGDFLTNDETGAALAGDPYAAMKSILGVQPQSWYQYSGSPKSQLIATATTHPALRDYLAGEVILEFDQISAGHFVPASGTAIQLAKVQLPGASYNGVVALERGGRVAHFGSEEIMLNGNLLWSVLQWAVYGNSTPLGLKITRNNSLFLSRTDMDQSMYAEEVSLVGVPLLNRVQSWKNAYNFVGSFYINIGNRPNQGEYTDWSVSAPLYRKYIGLGNEIGTHSYTHPDYTSQLTAEQLNFEFNQSKQVIAANLGVQIGGTAIPGNPESLLVDQRLDPYFTYTSGRYANVGTGFPGAFGYLTAASKMLYFSLNMYPDFTLIGWLKLNSLQAEQEWARQYAALLKHASQPFIHWLWHDYALTTELSSGYSIAMFENTLARAHGDGTEFATALDISNRIQAYRNSRVTVSETAGVLSATVAATQVGQCALRLYDPTRVIRSVDNWYAYGDKAVYLPAGGGQFTIRTGTSQDPVTRIVSLPMRAVLQNLSGDGRNLQFTMQGEGAVLLRLNAASSAVVTVSGADAISRKGNDLTLRFNGYGSHAVSVNVSEAGTTSTTTSTTTTTTTTTVTAATTTTTAPAAPIQPGIYFPAAVSIAKGSYDWGTLASFIVSDSDTYDIKAAAITGGYAADWYASRILSGSSAALKSMSVTYSGEYSNTGVTQFLYLYNFLTSTWDQIDSRVVGNSEVTVTFTVSSDLRRYIAEKTGELRLRVYGSKPSGTFFCWANVLKWDLR